MRNERWYGIDTLGGSDTVAVIIVLSCVIYIICEVCTSIYEQWLSYLTYYGGETYTYYETT